MSVGIHAYGGYVPKTRLQRSAIAAANAWFNPALKGLGKGERSIANWDEDAVTMAVEAARDCLNGGDDALTGVYMASTSLPFQDRQNAGIIVDALSLGTSLQTMDVAGSQRAGTSALATALQVAAGGGRILVAASEKRRTKSASPLELTSGDAGAAFVVADGDGIAKLLGQATESTDFIDHYRGQDEAYDYSWEERWIRDEGYLKIIPAAADKALHAASVDAAKVNHFCFPAAMARVGGMLAKKMGMPAESVRDNLQGTLGEAGSAHPLVMLAHALEEAKAGEIIVVVGFGQGCDALVFEVTDAIADAKPTHGISGYMARRRADDNYSRFLAINNLVVIEQGLRSEVDKQTGLTTHYRNKEMVQGLIGGECEKCGTLQFPKSNVCVNPNCHAVDSQKDHPFSGKIGKLNSYTADRLTYSMDPPAFYGMIQFDEGGRGMVDFTDVEPGRELQVGEPMRMMFRVKDYDTKRGFRRYFWKATPVNAMEGE